MLLNFQRYGPVVTVYSSVLQKYILYEAPVTPNTVGVLRPVDR